MSNSYSPCTANDILPCSPELAEKIKKSLELDDGVFHGLKCEYHPEEKWLYIFADESCFPENLPDESLDLIGKAIEAAGLPYMEFGIAFYGDRQRAGSCGGAYFRIMSDGQYIEPQTVWPKQSENIIKVNFRLKP